MTPIDKIDPGLVQFASVRQLEFIEAIEKHGSQSAAALALGMTRNTIFQSMARLREKAAKQHYAPEFHLNNPLPPTHQSKGFSQLVRRGEPEPLLTWYKASAKSQEIEAAIKAAAQGFIADLPQLPAPPPPREFSTDVIPWIQIGDAHLGMLAHDMETNENFDLKIAESELLAAIGMMIEEMPPCERCVINDLGDFTHYDNFVAQTAASGHNLDADGRFPKMLRVYSRVMRKIIEMALTKAHHVDVIINQGNHSRINDFWMRELLEVAYGYTGRVHVLNNDNVFIAYRMGSTLVMVHHSDKCPPARLVGVMTTDYRKDYGDTEFHYIDIGHIHHKMAIKEMPGVVIESWNTLAGKDNWAHSAGYRARQSLSVVLRSRTYGEIGRRTLPIEEVRSRMTRAGSGKAVVSSLVTV